MKKKLLSYFSVISNKRLLSIVIMCFLMLQINLYAQNTSVSGTVKSEAGATLPGVNVILKGTIIGTTTGADGKYSISVPENGTLVFSFIGYEKLEYPVNGRSLINVTLAESVKTLGEVVVVGYGSQKKKDLTGAVTVINGKELENRPNTQFGNSIEGKAAGVQVIRSSGQPQSGFSIKVRGTSSITSGTDPLYIVDGVQTYNINEINPADIESFSILKDASSAAIYGSSGSNGVVLITTKHGKNQKTQVTFNTSFMSSKAWKKMEVLNSTEFQTLATEMGLSTDWNQYTANTNWQDEVFRNAFTQNYQLSVSGGNENTTYYMSGSMISQEGIVLNNSVKRGTFKLNLDHKVSNFLKVGSNISYDKWTDISVPENDRNGVITRLITTVPIIGIWDTQNPYQYALSPFINDLENPVSTVYQPDQNYGHDRFHGNVYGEASLLPDLKFKSLLGFEHSNGIYTSFLNPVQTHYGRTMDGIAVESDDVFNYWVTENTLNYNKVIKNHAFSLLGGFIASRESGRSVYLRSIGFGGSTAISTVEAGTVQDKPGISIYDKSHASFIGRLNYAFKDKYLLTSNFRADGSGQFAKENRWSYFPSFSAGWRISQEKFFTNIKVVNDLKLRAGWGVVGNDKADPYAWYGLVNPSSYIIGGSPVTAYVPGTMENKSLKWEKTGQFNIGLDMALLESRIVVTADYYHKKTTDLLLNVPIPASVGTPGNTALQNAGSIENKGFEFQITSRNFVKPDFTWTTDINFYVNRGKVLDIVGTTIQTGAINPAGSTYNLAYVKAGLPLGSFYGFISEGVDPETGNIIFKDVNGDSIVDDNDRTVIGNANPKFSYGITNTLTYKNFSLDIFFQGVQGNDIFNATRILTESMSLGMNQSAAVLDRWMKEGDITDMPKSSLHDVSNSAISSRYIENGSYLRLKSVTLGYSLPQSVLTKLRMTRCMIYVTSENLLTFTKYSGFDPEMSMFNSSSSSNTDKNTAPGVDYGTYPQSRDFLVGLNITF